MNTVKSAQTLRVVIGMFVNIVVINVLGYIYKQLFADLICCLIDVVGLLIFFGAVLGRAVCGFLCPFGFLQDLIYKIPFYKKNRFKIDKFLRYLKYAVLLVLVIILPMTFKLTPFFCKYVWKSPS